MSQKTVRRLSIGDELMAADIFLRYKKNIFFIIIDTYILLRVYNMLL